MTKAARVPRRPPRADYVLKLDAEGGMPPLLSVFGGKITTYRRLAEAALAQLAPHLPAAAGEAAGWTGKTPLPGGDFPMQGFDATLRAATARYPFLSEKHLRRLLRAYGTRIHGMLAGVGSSADLGVVFGADLTEAELRYLVSSEWARSANDVLWRRSKLGLRLTQAEVSRVEDALQRIVPTGEPVA